VLPAGATANPNETDKNAAKQQCKAERADPGFAAAHQGKTFEQFYGTNKNGKNAHGKCVSNKAKKKGRDGHREPQDSHEFKNAARKVSRRTGEDRSPRARRSVRHQSQQTQRLRQVGGPRSPSGPLATTGHSGYGSHHDP